MKKCKLYLVDGFICNKHIVNNINAISLTNVVKGIILEYNLKDLKEVKNNDKYDICIRLQGSSIIHRYKVVLE